MGSGFRVTSVGITDVGRKRQNNEDNYLINDGLALFLAADGMGGYAGGELASQIAVNTVEEVLVNIQGDEASAPATAVDDSVNAVQQKLEFAIRLAGRRIWERALAEPELRGMGTTLLGLYFYEGNAFISHVGDSRTYRYRTGKIEQLTEDHSLVNEQIKAGLISPEHAKNHRLKNIITRSLGYQEEVEVDTRVEPLASGDIFLLCSDGFSNLVEEPDMEAVLSKSRLQDAAVRFVEMANERGGDDNITVVLVQVE